MKNELKSSVIRLLHPGSVRKAPESWRFGRQMIILFVYLWFWFMSG